MCQALDRFASNPMVSVADVAEMDIMFPNMDGAVVGDLLQTEMFGAIA